MIFHRRVRRPTGGRREVAGRGPRPLRGTDPSDSRRGRTSIFSAGREIIRRIFDATSPISPDRAGISRKTSTTRHDEVADCPSQIGRPGRKSASGSGPRRGGQVGPGSARIGPGRFKEDGAMAWSMRTCLGRATIGLGLAASLAAGQVVEREQDTRLTGPRGRTIERDIKVRAGAGIHRPSGRDQAARRDHHPRHSGSRPGRAAVHYGPGFGGPGFGGPRYYGGPAVRRERDRPASSGRLGVRRRARP